MWGGQGGGGWGSGQPQPGPGGWPSQAAVQAMPHGSVDWAAPGPAVDCGKRVTDDDGWRRRLLCPPSGQASPASYADHAEVPWSRAPASSSRQQPATASRATAATSAASDAGG